MEPYALRVDVEIDVIREHYPVRRASELAADLGIARGTLRSIACVLGLGLKRRHQRWTPEDRRTLQRYWGHESSDELAARLGRTREALHLERHRMKRRAQCGR